MSDVTLSAALAQAAEKIDAATKTFGPEVAETCHANSKALLEWANYFYMSERTGTCDEFIDGFRSSIVESVFCCASGLVRLATFSMRSQIDIALSWIYFKDHPVEYSMVHDTSNGFILKSDAGKYLTKYYPYFDSKFSKLGSVMTRKAKDPYRLLSAHVHSQSVHTMPAATDFSSMISDKALAAEASELQMNVSEYLEDVFLSCFGHKWANLPAAVIERAKIRLSSEDNIKTVFS